MKLKFKHLLLIAICCFHSLLVANANEKLWNDAKQNLAAPKYSAVMPEKFRTLQLDFDGINLLLAKALLPIVLVPCGIITLVNP